MLMSCEPKDGYIYICKCIYFHINIPLYNCSGNQYWELNMAKVPPLVSPESCKYFNPRPAVLF